MLKHKRVVAMLLCTLAASGCGEEDPAEGDSAEGEDSEQPTAQEQLAALDRDLTVGDVGADVVVVHRYLTEHGYFPNATLSRDYPSWRPLVAEGPAMPDVFDEQSARAVQLLQQRRGYPDTGVVDAATRELLQARTCGFPEGLTEWGGDEKFSLYSSNWGTKTAFTWRLTNTDDVTLVEARTAIYNAFQTWVAQTNITATEMGSGTADIMISFGNIDGLGTKLATTTPPDAGGDILIDSSENWSVAASTPAGWEDLQTQVLHELGHSLGLFHSSDSLATMYPDAATNDRTLGADDKVAISAKLDIPSSVAGSGVASDIAVSPDGQHVWIVTLTATSGGYTIRKYNFSTSSWDTAAGGASQIAVEPGGTPWIVTNGNQIYRRTSNSATSGSWTLMPGSARDISVGAGGAVWIINNSSAGGGNYGVSKWNSGTSGWDIADGSGAGTRIAVHPGGTPWIINASNAVYRRSTPLTSGGSWSSIPGTMRHIAFDPSGYAWGTEIAAAPSGGSYISLWNEQTAFMDAPSKSEWARMLKSAGMVVAGGSAGPWVVNNGGAILRSVK